MSRLLTSPSQVLVLVLFFSDQYVEKVDWKLIDCLLTLEYEENQDINEAKELEAKGKH